MHPHPLIVSRKTSVRPSILPSLVCLSSVRDTLYIHLLNANSFKSTLQSGYTKHTHSRNTPIVDGPWRSVSLLLLLLLMFLTVDVQISVFNAYYYCNFNYADGVLFSGQHRPGQATTTSTRLNDARNLSHSIISCHRLVGLGQGRRLFTQTYWECTWRKIN